MRLLPIALLIIIITVTASSVCAQSEWICGTITSTPVEATYGMTFYMFDFNVTSSDLGIITCVGLKTFGPFNTTPQLGESHNFSGQFVTSQISNNTVPVGVFIITTVNSNTALSSNQTSDWLGALKGGFDFLSGIGKWIVTFIVAISSLGGIALPEYIVAFPIAAVTGILVLLRLRWAVTLTALLLEIVVTSFIIQTYLLLLIGINF